MRGGCDFSALHSIGKIAIKLGETLSAEPYIGCKPLMSLAEIEVKSALGISPACGVTGGLKGGDRCTAPVLIARQS